MIMIITQLWLNEWAMHMDPNGGTDRGRMEVLGRHRIQLRTL